jgi:K+-sensing histidine kinase KdpD
MGEIGEKHSTPRITWLALALAVALPLVLAAGMVPFRNDIANANVALILAAAVVLVASLGRRAAAFVAAASAFVWFDFFHTRPYESFRINSGDDLLTACVLLAVGLFVGELAVRNRYHRSSAVESSNDIARIHSVAELVADGEAIDYLVMVVANELRDLLSLRECRFDPHPGTKPTARLERSGAVVIGQLRWGVHSMGFPGSEVELPVVGQGQVLGRYVLVPTPAAPVSFDKRIVAVALADQLGAALAATAASTKT